MLTFIQRRALEAEDWLRYHPTVRGLLSRYARWRDRPPPADDPQAIARSIVRLCAAARLAPSADAEARIQDVIRDRVGRLAGRPIDWTEFVPGADRTRIPRGIVLKPYVGPGEPGVLFISFEGEWVRLLNAADVRALAGRYTLVVAPSSSPHNLVNYVFPALYPGPVYTLISNPGDQAVLPGVAPTLRVVPLYASCWVNPDRFDPLPRERRPYDLIMVASFGKVKRHQVLFRALRRMPRDLRVLLIGQDQDGRTAETIREVARWYGVADRFTLLQNQAYPEVTRAFGQARASLILSRREGSCVVVTESFFADTPAAVLAGAELGSRVFINDQTGRFVREKDLARDLTAFVREADRYEPRRWAEQHISCYQSSRVLNDVLKAAALAGGGAWTQDLAPLQWAPDPQLARPEDRPRLAAERAEILAKFGLEIGPL